MLFDPKWKEAEVKAAPFGSLDHFIAWLETRDPAETYLWCSVSDCLLCRHGAEHGVTSHVNLYVAVHNKVCDMHRWADLVLAASGRDTTVGSALTRARKLRAHPCACPPFAGRM